MNPTPRVLAIVVNYEGREVLPPLLGCLDESDCPGLETMVVDCASQDESWRLVQAPHKLLRVSSNRGYGAALNSGLREAFQSPQGPPDYFLLLNNDLEFGPDLVRRLVEFAQDQGPGVFGPRILDWNRPERLDAAWGRVNWSHVLCRFKGKGSLDGPSWRRSRRVELLLGCALLADRSVFEQVGQFDERFFMYHEEVDFLYRCRLKGVPVRYCPFAAALHRGAFSTRRTPLKKVYWVRRNAVLFLRKHRAGPLRWAYFFATLAASLKWNLIRLRTKRAAAILRGACDGLRRGDPEAEPGQAAPSGEGA